MYNRDLDEDLQKIDLDDAYDEEDEEELRAEEELKSKNNKSKKKKALLKEILANSLYLLVVLIGTLLFVRFVAQRTVVNGDSMNPTLTNMDNLIVDKVSYKLHEPERFDVVVFPYEYKKDTFYIKRIIGLPGETVRIDTSGNIYINEELLLEDYGAEVILEPGNALNGVTLGPDEFFVLGDNRNHSSDSRTTAVGVVPKEKIIGKAWLRIYPFNSIGFVKK